MRVSFARASSHFHYRGVGPRCIRRQAGARSATAATTSCTQFFPGSARRHVIRRPANRAIATTARRHRPGPGKSASGKIDRQFARGSRHLEMRSKNNRFRLEGGARRIFYSERPHYQRCARGVRYCRENALSKMRALLASSRNRRSKYCPSRFVRPLRKRRRVGKKNGGASSGESVKNLPELPSPGGTRGSASLRF